MNRDEKHQKGFYRKYRVARLKPHSDVTKNSVDCRFFVLDYPHDPHALVALRAYAESCEQDYPALADHLLAILDVYE